jgi:hypothetical protein
LIVFFGFVVYSLFSKVWFTKLDAHIMSKGFEPKEKRKEKCPKIPIQYFVLYNIQEQDSGQEWILSIFSHVS